MRSIAGWLGVLALVVWMTGCECGDDMPGDVDSGPGGDDAGEDAGPRVDAGPITRCGDGMVEGAEECDDFNEDPDDGCSPTCELECGDGALSPDELCDPAIAAGEDGACPTDCDDGDACTTDSLDGSGCEVQCSNGPIGAPIDDDGCCPTGADSTNDNDCTATCGNDVVEEGELCDTGIDAGEDGACPATCDDGQACTMDSVSMAGTCVAVCTSVAITDPADGDGCCPSGGSPTNDSDCAAECGDGIVSSPAETCDTAIATGTGSCPTACDDEDMCTTDTLMNAGTCTARCASAPVAAGAADGCCPRPAANIMNDVDCPAMCGDRVLTAPEACDDGNTTSGDGCSATCTFEVTGFRFTDLDLMDPHVFADAPLIGCRDVTNLSFPALDLYGVNPLVEQSITEDGNGDGDLDLSLIQAFTPLVQTAGMSAPGYIAFPDCTAPMSSTMCTLPATAARTSGTAMNMGGAATCLGVVPGTTRASYDPIVVSTAPAGGTCYVANAGTITFNLSGIAITLRDAQIAGEWFGNPATEIRDGLIRGFISEADATATTIPEGTTGVASIDGEPLSSLLRGGPDNCDEPAPMMGDKDTLTLPDGTMITGWYFYLNFTAARVPYTEL